MRISRKDMEETPIYFQTRRETKYLISPVMYPPCLENECIPDRLGYCKVCGHEVLQKVDEDGDPRLD